MDCYIVGSAFVYCTSFGVQTKQFGFNIAGTASLIFQNAALPIAGPPEAGHY